MILCPKCFTANDDNAKFCAKCGDPLGQQVDDVGAEETTILNTDVGFDFGSNTGRVQSENSASVQMSGSASGTGAGNAPSAGVSQLDSGAGKSTGSQAPTSKMGIIALAIAAISVILAVVCLVMLLTTPKEPAAVEQPASSQPESSENSAEPEKVIVSAQPDRSANEKTDALDVDLKDMDAVRNMPGRINTEDASKVKNLPSAIKGGKFIALWDCDVLTMSGDGKATLLVTIREMHPTPGRIWVTWYDQDHWTGWKALTPS